MKILLLNQTFHPDRVATAQHLLDLALYLRARGATVSVLTGRRGYENRSLVFPKRETLQGIEVHRVSSTGFGKRSFWTRFLDSLSFDFMLLLKLLFFPKQDVVVSFTSPPLLGFLGVIRCLLRGEKSVQWMMDVNPDAAIEVGYLKRESVAARLLTSALEFSLRKSWRVVVLDRFMKRRLSAHGADETNMIVAPPWPLPELFSDMPSGANNTFRREHGLDGKFVVLYSGNMSIVHPLETLIKAAQRMKEDPSVVFLFIGGGLRVKEVQSAIDGGATNMRLLPWQPRETLPYSLSSGDLHVVVMGEHMSGLAHTSKVYGVLSTGKPYVFIGPRDSHVGDLQKECAHGFQVEHGGVDELLKVIDEARKLSKEKLDDIRRGNTEYLRKHFTVEKCLAEFESKVLASLTKQSRAKLAVGLGG